MPNLRLILQMLLVLALAGAAGAPPAQASVEEATAKLDLAEIHLQLGNPERTLTLAEEALEAAPEDEATREGAERLIDRALAARAAAEAQAANATEAAEREENEKEERRIQTVLDEAERLVEDGDYDAARTLLTPELAKATGTQLEDVDELLDRSHPPLWPKKLGDLWRGWLSDAVLVVIVLLVIYFLVLKPLRWGYARRGKITVGDVDDSTSLGVGEMVLSTLERWRTGSSTVSAGLLWLPPPEAGIVPSIEAEPQPIDFSTAFGSLPNVGGVPVKAVGDLLTALPKWFTALRPRITSNCLVDGQKVVIQLTYRASQRTRTIRCEAEKTSKELAAAVESATFQLYSLLANPKTVINEAAAAAADQMRLGIEDLRRYLAGGESGALAEAHQKFLRVRYAQPQLLEASLYEGLSLDLTEEHDRALEVFATLAENPGATRELRLKARYNHAVAHVRKYTPDDFREALGTFDELLDETRDRPLSSFEGPLHAFVEMARANTIAHQPIFWQEFACGVDRRSKDPVVVLSRKQAAVSEVDAWWEEVEQAAERVGKLASDGRATHPEVWRPALLRQLRWTRHNALGNFHLNKGSFFLDQPNLGPERDAERARVACLEQAYEEFRRCEAILRPGVETLTNLATVSNALERLKEGREYAERAIELNDRYEYAYYRLALNWEAAGDEARVRETLARLPKRPTFSMGLFEKYGVRPKA